MQLFMPEFYLRSFLLRAQSDIYNSIIADVNDNLITKIFSGIGSSGEFNPAVEAQGIFSPNNNPIKIMLGLNIDTANLPSAHIYLPNTDVSFQGIGNSPSLIRDNTNPNSPLIAENNETYYNSIYSVLLVDKNADSLILIYNTLLFMMLSYISEMELIGFMNLKISGNDFVTEQNLIPQTLYARNINFAFEYTQISQNDITFPAGVSFDVNKPKLVINMP